MTKRRKRVRQEPLVLLIGSGIHREVLGPAWRCSPLASWEELLRCTAKKSELPASTMCSRSLVTAWEAMVLHALRHGFKDSLGTWVDSSKPPARGAASVDRALRAVCRSIILHASKDLKPLYRSHETIMRLRGVSEQRQLHLVDFNFDSLVCEGIDVKLSANKSIPRWSRSLGLSVEEHAALFRSWRIKGSDGSRVWKPHGWLGPGKSLRLGMRDFGLQGGAYRWAFGIYKANERGHRQQESSGRGTWIASVMKHECRSFGLGIGPDEWGLRWLLFQREREQARKKRPQPFTIFRSPKDPPPLGASCADFESWPYAAQAVLDSSIDVRYVPSGVM
jgi:hypothetical protein